MTKRIIGLAVALATTMALAGTASAQTSDPREFTLNVVHGIPEVVVDVCVNGEKAITDFDPGEVVTGVMLPETSTAKTTTSGRAVPCVTTG